MNISLIGMPGAGKSTVGIVLAKQMGMQFIDTDILIQIREHATLEQILQQQGYVALRKIEGEIIQQLDAQNSVIATGGSAVYNRGAMQNLQRLELEFNRTEFPSSINFPFEIPEGYSKIEF